jgi:hypothetical protein
MGKFTVKNIKIVKDQVILTGELFLDVTADIYDGDTLIETKKYGFSFGTSAEEIKAAITKSLATMRLEIEQKEKNKDRDALEKHADEAIEELSGLEITEPVN